jgi:hypothetical protein
MGKDTHLKSKGKIDIRIVFDEKSSNNLRHSAERECRTLAAQIRFIVQEWYDTSDREQPHA